MFIIILTIVINIKFSMCENVSIIFLITTKMKLVLFTYYISNFMFYVNIYAHFLVSHIKINQQSII
jgi:hypothetical protein